MCNATRLLSINALDLNGIEFKKKHSGIAVITILVIISLLATGVIIYSLNQASIQAKKDKQTAYALFEAKSALIGFAVKEGFEGSARPGELPCPDLNNDGEAETSCSASTRRLGRLPWKTLGLGDLRDGNSERLWYAVSDNFKNNPRTVCDFPDQPGCLNSDTIGTITVRNNSGATILNASNLNEGGAIAVIFSTGIPIKRQDSTNTQNRSCEVGVNCDSAKQCITTPATLTPLCNPFNYLETTSGEDNADFIDGSTNGFVQGKIYDGNGNVVLNDLFVLLKNEDLAPILEKMVGKEVENCLINYAANNNQRYPYAALVSSGAASPNYSDSAGMLFGRIPDEPFSKTELDSKPPGPGPGPGPASSMSDKWSNSCSISSANDWWVNWKEQVFYGLASAYKPNDDSAPSCGSCLTVNAQTQKKFVVIVSGKKISAQVRQTNSDKNNLSNYLEDENADSDTAYTQQSTTSTFNDNLYYQ